MNQGQRGWIAACDIHGWTVFFGDDKDAARKAWAKHLADYPGCGCDLMGPGVYREGVGDAS